MKKCPCKDCKDRFIGCQSSCKKDEYKLWSDEIEKIRNRRKSESETYPVHDRQWYQSVEGYWRNNEMKRRSKKK